MKICGKIRETFFFSSSRAAAGWSSQNPHQGNKKKHKLNRVNHYTQLGAIFKSIIINFI
jgi:hypothetical protein